ncbi:putative late blight resistance protein homolog R1C-3 [Salvia hispanica]|uniref:putative late blight resistance protein homolog R1C-3 n=1 Tax=Salvia hispanica TaxID=49212 RepID=UPI00200915D7|nr:putative late blight resistance protein homolog R1C-3 [Salvia hispanica]
MAAYGALVSLMNIIETLEKHPSPPISIHKQQVESLTQIVTFFQEFLDAYISPVVADGHEADPLERRIADAVYAAEDVFESHIVDQIHRQSKKIRRFRRHGKSTIKEEFYHNLQQVIAEMNLVQEEVKKIAVKAQLQQKPIAALASSSTVRENMMVGFEEVYAEVLDKLTRDHHRNCQMIISITGMGGIGKTTLARHLFENALVKEHFDIRAWTTISQTYNVREILKEVLLQASGDSSDLSEANIGLTLYRYLSGRKYLIIMDDMWSIEVWYRIKRYFPNFQNKSRIIMTTRLSNLCSELDESYGVSMEFLDEANSWDFFSKTVFGNESCPLELENIGKNIVANCKGLPLSIATIGGLLAKSECKRVYWENIEQNLSSIVSNSNDDFFLKILRMSYIYLPNYLKPCFLYMGVFEEDSEICVSTLLNLWVSEGLLKPMSGKCLDTIAQEYFKELVDRNLILVDKLGSNGNVKYCKLRYLVRDLCLKEVEKERFYRVIRNNPPANISERRVVFPFDKKVPSHIVLGSFSHVRSIIFNDYEGEIQMLQNFRLLRTLKAYDHYLGASCGANFLDIAFELLKGVKNLFLNEHVVKRIPNVKKLYLKYDEKQIGGENSLSYLQCLSKLESFFCEDEDCHEYLHKIRFPNSLKRLFIHASRLELEGIMSKIGSLPLLEKLAVHGGFFKTRKWETFEGQFPSLKFMRMSDCDDLEDWIVFGNSNFPLLKELHLCYMSGLKEIPLQIADISTLEYIHVEHCSESAVVSAKKIEEEREKLFGDQKFLVRVVVVRIGEALKSLESANFEVETISPPGIGIGI